MAMRTPQLKKHATGQFFVKWGGKNHYLGTDRKQAEQLYAQQIADWMEWRTGKRLRRAESNRYEDLYVFELVEQFIANRIAERGMACGENYRKNLTRFTHIFGKVLATDVRPKHLNQVKVDLKRHKLKPRTINHTLTAVRVMFNWASAIELVPPISYSGVKNVPIGPARDESLPPERIRTAIHLAEPKIAPLLAINYLALLRPSEVVKVIHGEGEWVRHGVFALDRGKMDARATLQRHCMFSDEALEWLDRCQPIYSRLDGYSAAACRNGIRPKLLQKSAAAHLHQLWGATRDDVELLLGHAQSRLGVSYYLPAFDRLRQVAAQLSLRCDGPSPQACNT